MSAPESHAVRWLAPGALLCGCVALATRTPGTIGGLGITAIVGVIGLLGPLPSCDGARPGLARWVGTVVLGVAAFAAARWLRPPIVSTPGLPSAYAANTLAAVAEELFFRRFMYGWLLRWGAGLATGGSAAAFAAVHFPAYGMRALPIDFAAGLLFGWQRWVSHDWWPPALTHVAANILQTG